MPIETRIEGDRRASRSAADWLAQTFAVRLDRSVNDPFDARDDAEHAA